jgi:hypothetical protein
VSYSGKVEVGLATIELVEFDFRKPDFRLAAILQ